VPKAHTVDWGVVASTVEMLIEAQRALARDFEQDQRGLAAEPQIPVTELSTEKPVLTDQALDHPLCWPRLTRPAAAQVSPTRGA
jgi:hypothetical protein